jgi:hypothetical protein
MRQPHGRSMMLRPSLMSPTEHEWQHHGGELVGSGDRHRVGLPGYDREAASRQSRVACSAQA